MANYFDQFDTPPLPPGFVLDNQAQGPWTQYQKPQGAGMFDDLIPGGRDVSKLSDQELTALYQKQQGRPLPPLPPGFVMDTPASATLDVLKSGGVGVLIHTRTREATANPARFWCRRGYCRRHAGVWLSPTGLRGRL